jgi:hypothetical protein
MIPLFLLLALALGGMCGRVKEQGIGARE